MLFLIFINDLGPALKFLKYKLYADNTVLCSKLSDENDIARKNNIQKDQDNVYMWCEQNAMQMNVKKTKTMMFGSRQKVRGNALPVIRVDGRSLECVPFYKYLGTFLDSELTLTKQSNTSIKFIPYKPFFLIKIKRYLNTDLLIGLYKAYIQPYLDYNDIYSSKAPDNMTNWWGSKTSMKVPT